MQKRSFCLKNRTYIVRYIYRKEIEPVKKKRLLGILFACLIGVAVFVSACGASSGTKDEGLSNEGGYVAEDWAADGNYGYREETENSVIKPSDKKETKIIHTASLSVETKEFDTTMDRISQMVQGSEGCYFEDKNVSSYAGSLRSAYMTIRVPSQNMSSFLEQLKGVGTVVSERENAEDVSEYYYDIDSRLTTAKIKLERLQALLEEASDMSDIITLEAAISEVEYEIDEMQGTLNHYDSKVNYATIDISVSEVTSVSNVDNPISFGERISSAFSKSLSGFVEFLKDAAVFIASTWIWLLILIVLPLIVLFSILGHFKKKRKMQAKQLVEAEAHTQIAAEEEISDK